MSESEGEDYKFRIGPIRGRFTVKKRSFILPRPRLKPGRDQPSQVDWRKANEIARAMSQASADLEKQRKTKEQ